MNPSQLTSVTAETSKATSIRQKNWLPVEDKQLCRSWISISIDAVVGVDQKGSSLWKRIHDFEDCRSTNIERTLSSLESRWGIIQRKVSKFCGCLAQVEANAIDNSLTFGCANVILFVCFHCFLF
jgi:hypothetical protein